MKKIIAALSLVLFAVIGAAAATYTVDQVPNIHIGDRTRHVSNPDGIIDPASEASMNTLLDSLRRQSTVEAVVVALDDIDTDIDDFATRLFEAWGLGKDDKDNGLLILLVKEQRKVTIRPGYGLEGVLPDITCGNIISGVMRPYFADGQYGAGLLAGLQPIAQIITDPDNADELRSQLADADDTSSDDDDLFALYISVVILMTLGMVAWLIYKYIATSSLTPTERYRSCIGMRIPYIVMTFIGIGLPLIALLPLLLSLHHWRNHRRRCPNCSRPMLKVDEVNDNNYLTPSQDLEEKIGSVDYDVWLCQACGETDIIPYVSQTTIFKECPVCHARALRLRESRIIVRPTAYREGKRLEIYECLNCHTRTERTETLPREDDSVGAAAAIGAAAALGGRGGGGSFGGGFGGGHTGGGGATGGW